MAHTPHTTASAPRTPAVQPNGDEGEAKRTGISSIRTQVLTTSPAKKIRNSLSCLTPIFSILWDRDWSDKGSSGASGKKS